MKPFFSLMIIMASWQLSAAACHPKSDQEAIADLAETFFPFHFNASEYFNTAKEITAAIADQVAIQKHMACEAFGEFNADGGSTQRSNLIDHYLLDFVQFRETEFELYKEAFPKLPSHVLDHFILKKCSDQSLSIGFGPGSPELHVEGCFDDGVTVLEGNDPMVSFFDQTGKKLRLAWLSKGEVAYTRLPLPLETNLRFPKSRLSVSLSFKPSHDVDALIGVNASEIDVLSLQKALNEKFGTELLGLEPSLAKASYQMTGIPEVALVTMMATVVEADVHLIKRGQYWLQKNGPATRLVPMRCPDGACRFSIPDPSITTTRNEGGLTMEGSERQSTVILNTVWLSHSQLQSSSADVMADLASELPKLSHFAYQPKWITQAKEPICPSSRRVYSYLSRRLASYFICALDDQNADRIAESIVQLGLEKRPSNPFAGEAIFQETTPIKTPRMDAIGKAVSKKDWNLAAQHISALVLKGNDLDLALVFSNAGNSQDAIRMTAHLLEKGVRHDLLDLAGQEIDHVRDQRYLKLERYAIDLERYATDLRHAQVFVTTPSQFDNKNPAKLLFALHGYGSHPNSFSGSLAQTIADQNQVVVVSVSARRRLDEGQFSWEEHVESDEMQIRFAEDVFNARFPGVTVAERSLFGFSQGGQMALEIAAAYPERYRDAAGFSPGSLNGLELHWLKADEQLKDRHFLISVNDEHELNQKWAKSNAQRLNSAGATVQSAFNEHVKTHSLPNGFLSLLKTWQSRLD